MTIRDKYLNQKRNRMIVKNQNLLMCIVGGTGSGKTYGAIQLAYELMNNHLDPDRHIVFDIQEFISLINKGIKKGEVIIFEEAGVNLSSKDWGTKANKNINKVLQTCRHLNFGVIFTLPNYRFMDNSSRNLQHGILVANEKNIDYKTNIAKLKTYDLILRPMRNTEPLTVFPKFYYDGTLITMKYLHLRKPNEDILKRYEERKKEFTTALNREVEKELIIEKFNDSNKKHFDVFCRNCKSKNSFDYSKRRNEWTCRRCGEVYTTSPYKMVKQWKTKKTANNDDLMKKNLNELRSKA